MPHAWNAARLAVLAFADITLDSNVPSSFADAFANSVATASGNNTERALETSDVKVLRLSGSGVDFAAACSDRGACVSLVELLGSTKYSTALTRQLQRLGILPFGSESVALRVDASQRTLEAAPPPPRRLAPPPPSLPRKEDNFWGVSRFAAITAASCIGLGLCVLGACMLDRKKHVQGMELSQYNGGGLLGDAEALKVSSKSKRSDASAKHLDAAKAWARRNAKKEESSDVDGANALSVVVVKPPERMHGSPRGHSAATVVSALPRWDTVDDDGNDATTHTALEPYDYAQPGKMDRKKLVERAEACGADAAAVAEAVPDHNAPPQFSIPVPAGALSGGKHLTVYDLGEMSSSSSDDEE